MKKIIALVITVAMLFTLAAVSAFAEEGRYVWNHTGSFVDNPFEGTFRVGSDFPTTGTVAFETDVSFSKVFFPKIWATKNGELTFRLISRGGDELFKNSFVMYNEVFNSGDVSDVEVDLGKTVPAGKYTFEFSVPDGQYAFFARGEGPLPSTYIEPDRDGQIMFGLWTTDSGAGFVEISDVKTVSIYSGAAGELTPHDLLGGGSIAVIITVPEGYALAEVIGVKSPTWENKEGGSDAKAELYAWTGDYDDTLDGDVLAAAEVKDHADNSNAVFTFDKQYAAGTYLVLFTATGEHNFGFWADSEIEGDAAVFQNDAEVDWYPRINMKIVLDEGQGVSIPVPDDQTGEQQGDQPGDITPQEPNTGTGDTSSVVFVVIAVLALCATVVLKKKRVF